MLGNRGGGRIDQFYHIIENSKSIICAELSKFAISWQIWAAYLSVFGITTYFPPNVATPGIPTVDDRVGSNLTNGARRLRRISFDNPNFGLLIMLGIYADLGSIFEIGDTSRAGTIRIVGKFCYFCNISGMRSYRF